MLLATEQNRLLRALLRQAGGDDSGIARPPMEWLGFMEEEHNGPPEPPRNTACTRQAKQEEIEASGNLLGSGAGTALGSGVTSGSGVGSEGGIASGSGFGVASGSGVPSSQASGERDGEGSDEEDAEDDAGRGGDD
ncbi:hypothetical protein GALMADRAFT_141669 [Galerina marginata CBS 339.88]|uniref:Uncharacterized protein n=1 Tax=Galerina marginata (strain CBS 339.88) TaxID=685588 RepID=A0A067T1T8_GALM3|nr:hypothetical protein GALMADRAFT_141669 [Galerina marginata CBS 339.88]